MFNHVAVQQTTRQTLVVENDNLFLAHNSVVWQSGRGSTGSSSELIGLSGVSQR